MIGWVILLVVLLLLLLPISARFRFDGESRLTVRYAGIPVWRFFSTDKQHKKKSTRAEVSSDRKSADKGKGKNSLKELTARLKEDGVAAVADYLRELAGLLVGTARRVLRILWFGRCIVQMSVATPEASETALRYGKLCAVLSPAAELLRQNLHVRRLELILRPDFLREKGEVRADVRVCVLPVMVLWAALATLFSYVGILIRQGNSK